MPRITTLSAPVCPHVNGVAARGASAPLISPVTVMWTLAVLGVVVDAGTEETGAEDGADEPQEANTSATMATPNQERNLLVVTMKPYH